MSKLFKILITLLLICLSCTTVFACGGMDDEESTPESEIVSVPESEGEESEESESKEEVVVDSESNFEVELPEVDRM